MPQSLPNIGTYKFQLSSGSLLDYLFICLLITINIQQGTRLRGITGGLIYRGTEMSRGHSGWGDLNWLALMGHAAQTRKQTACHWAPSWTDAVICHALRLHGIIQTALALLKPTVMYGEGKSYKEDKDTFVRFLPAGILIVRYQIPIRIKTILVCILWLLVMLFLLKIWLLEHLGLWQHPRKMYISFSIPNGDKSNNYLIVS